MHNLSVIKQQGEFVMNKKLIMAGICLFYFHSSYNAEQQGKPETIVPIALAEGLLTQLSITTVKLIETERGWLESSITQKKKNSVVVENKKATLARLMSMYALKKSYSEQRNNFPSGIFFCPVYLKIDENDKWDSSVFYGRSDFTFELEEACRQRKGYFYPYKDGMIIYYLGKKLSPDFFEANAQELQALIDKSFEHRLF